MTPSASRFTPEIVDYCQGRCKLRLIDIIRLQQRFASRYPKRFVTIDSHTAGEPTRLIVAGADPIPGETMVAKRNYCATELDHLRLVLTREPRGHRDIFAALLTEPVTEEAAFGLVYMDARRYPYLCGHGTMGAVTTLIEMGELSLAGPEGIVVVDTPSGQVATRVTIDGGKVASVSLQMVPAFVYAADEQLEVPGIGSIRVDIVCAGGFFVMVPLEQVDLTFTPQDHPRFVELGMELIELANDQLTVRHPTRPEVTTVDVAEFYDNYSPAMMEGRGIVIYGEAHMDRSPCGTGTTAKLALLHYHGHVPVGAEFRNLGPLGTGFDARIVAETYVGEYPAVIVEVAGRAHISGFHQFVVDPDDPFPEGFLL